MQYIYGGNVHRDRPMREWGRRRHPRLRRVMSSLVTHLHAFIKDVELTEAEWGTAIDFLTQTGQICSDTRQEFILLSDVLGVSMLVDAVNNRVPDGATGNDRVRPVSRRRRPGTRDGARRSAWTARGRPAFSKEGFWILMASRSRTLWSVSGRIMRMASTTSSNRIFSGLFNNRGIFRTGPDGRYAFRGIKPVSYPIPDDGPVGKMLAALGAPSLASCPHAFHADRAGLSPGHHATPSSLAIPTSFRMPYSASRVR